MICTLPYRPRCLSLFSNKVVVAGAEVVEAGGAGEGGTEAVEVEGEGEGEAPIGMTAGRRNPLQRLWR